MTPLEESYLFQGIPAATMKKIGAVSELVPYAEGVWLFQEGDLASHCYAMAEGEVELIYIVHARSPVNLEIAHLKPGDMFGWSALAGVEKFTGNARTIKDSKVWRIPVSKLCEIMESDAESGYRIMSRLAQLIAERMHEVRTEIRWFLSSL